MFPVEFSDRAFRELAALDRSTQMRVLRTLEPAAKDPAWLFMSLKSLEGFRMRVGGLRVLVDIRDEERVILTAKIEERDSVYKR